MYAENSGAFQPLQHAEQIAFKGCIRFTCRTKIKHLFCRIEQCQGQYQLGITALERTADFLQPAIDKGFDSMNLLSRSRTPD